MPIIKRLRFCLTVVLVPLMFACSSVRAEDWQWASQYPVSTKLPDIQLPDHSGQPQRFNELIGENGSFLVFSRSTDW